MKRKSNLITICLILIFLLCFGVNVSAETNTTRTAITILTEKAEGKIYLTYSKKNVDGYQVRWAPNSKMTNAKSASSTKTELYRSGLIGGKTYYFQVRTYKKINGKKVYSIWSPMKSIKLKKLPPTTTITSLKANSSSSFTVKWTKKSGVKGYQIRYSTDSSFKTKKTASTLKNTHTRKDLAKGTYYVSVRSYNVAADGTKYYSNWSGMKRVTLTAAGDKKKVYSAYADIVKRYESKYGKARYITRMLGSSYPHCEGVYFLDLIDFDKNGIEELIIAYRNRENWREVTCDIYSYDQNSNKTVALYSGESGFEVYGCADAYYFCIYHYSNQSFICSTLPFVYDDSESVTFVLRGYDKIGQFGTAYSALFSTNTLRGSYYMGQFGPMKFEIGYPNSYDKYVVYGQTEAETTKIRNKVSSTKKKLGI